MREITVPLKTFAWPYLVRVARETGRRELSSAQRRAVVLMREGVWYERENGDPLPTTLGALVWKGWCREAVVARRNADGKVVLWDRYEFVFHVLLGMEPQVQQPFSLFRLVDGAHAALGEV